jgi:hypothetical protein
LSPQNPDPEGPDPTPSTCAAKRHAQMGLRADIVLTIAFSAATAEAGKQINPLILNDFFWSGRSAPSKFNSVTFQILKIM